MCTFLFVSSVSIGKWCMEQCHTVTVNGIVTEMMRETGHKTWYKTIRFRRYSLKNAKMKILPLLFGYIFQGSAGAGPISQTNICITECTGVADDWTDYHYDGKLQGIKVDG